MDKINRKHFWDNFPFKKTQAVITNIEKIIDYFDSKDYLLSLKWLAYALATVKHETNETYAPVIEGYWIKSGRIHALKKFYFNKPQYNTIFPKGKLSYEGRGLVQLTHNFNYINAGKLIGIDLLNYPALALVMYNAVKIMFEGMYHGIFTGFRFSSFLNENKMDWEAARKIINGKDKKALIAGYAQSFYNILEFEESTLLTPSPIQFPLLRKEGAGGG